MTTPPWNDPSQPTPPPVGPPGPPYAGPPSGVNPYQQPYGQPGYPVGYPTPTGLKPRRRRPSGWWWLLPAVLFTLAGVAAAVLLGRAFAPFLDAEGTVPVDGSEYTIRLTTLEQHLLLVSNGSCTVTDPESGSVLPLSEVGGTSSSSSSHFYHFTPTGYDVTISCSGDPNEEALVAPDPGNAFLTGLIAGILLPLALGGIALIVTIVLIVLFATGAPRNRPAV